MTDRQALLSAAGKQRPYKAVNIKPPAMPGVIYFLSTEIGGSPYNERQIDRKSPIDDT